MFCLIGWALQKAYRPTVGNITIYHRTLVKAKTILTENFERTHLARGTETGQYSDNSYLPDSSPV